MSLIVGIARLARFRADGFAFVPATPQAVANSLAPLLAFPLVSAGLLLAEGELREALSQLLATMIALLAPLVVSHNLAVRWGKEQAWYRYAAAVNWCQWALPAMFLALRITAGVLAMLGLGLGPSIMLGALVLYGIALHWFLARRGLDLSRGRTLLLIAAADVTTSLLVLGPHILAQILSDTPA